MGPYQRISRVKKVWALAQFAKRMKNRGEPNVTPPQDALEALRLGFYLGFRKGYLLGLGDGAVVASGIPDNTPDPTSLVIAP
jgi:hypothetical protein